MYRNGIKRLLAIVLSLCGMVCLSWLFLILAVAIKLDSPGPVFFKQKRVGIGKKHFYILKFRTMRIDTPHDMPTHLLHDPDQYITRMGHFLRKTSLDELPQLWNIFVGDMAVIGPRPALWNQYDLLAERDKYHANDVRPGLTGWAQIHGRDELEIAEKAKLDGWYVEHLSFGCEMLLRHHCRCAQARRRGGGRHGHSARRNRQREPLRIAVACRNPNIFSGKIFFYLQF